MSNDDQQNQMRKLRDQAIYETDPQVRRNAIDALGTYGKRSIDLLQQVAESPVVDDSIKAYALNKIKYANMF